MIFLQNQAAEKENTEENNKMESKNFYIISIALIIVILILINNMQAQGTTNPIIVEGTDDRTPAYHDYGLPSRSVTFSSIARGTEYVTDLDSGTLDYPYPFIIRNMGTSPLQIWIYSDTSAGCSGGTPGDLFCDPNSKVYFWVEQPYIGNAAPWTNLDDCGTIPCFNMENSCFGSTPCDGGPSCRNGFTHTVANCCLGGQNCYEIGQMLGSDNQKLILSGLKPMTDDTHNEAILNAKIFATNEETSGAKTVTIMIHGVEG